MTARPILNAHPLAPAPTARGPLGGVGILVTRPARQAAGLASALAALGATPIIIPAIVILPPSDSAPLAQVHAQLDRFDIAIFVSANAVEYGVPALERWPSRIQVFAPGPGTAAALAAVQVAGTQIPQASFDSEGLLALPALTGIASKRIVIFRGEGGRELLVDALRARGASVTAVACYRRAAPETIGAGLAEVLRDGRAHALTLTSSEGLDNLCNVLDVAALRRMRQLPAFAPHPRIAAHARAAGFQAIETEGADAGLIAGLLEWFVRHPLTSE